MVWTILALLSLVALGGFISYYGDLQGRRWGKRRVTWFGMRPKHTAILITILTGAFISLLSVITLLLISPPVREVVLRGERAIADEKHLVVQLAHDQTQYKFDIDRLDHRRDIEQQAKQEAETQAQRARSDLAQVKTQLGALQSQKDGLDVKVRQEGARVTQLQQKEQGLQQSIARLSDQNVRLNRANRQLTEVNSGLAKQNIGLERDNTRLSADNTNLQASNRTLKKESEELSKDNGVLLTTNNQLLNDAQSKERDLQQNTVDLARAKDELEQVNKKLDDAYGILARSDEYFSRNYLAVRQGKIGVRVGSELARRTLDAHMSAPAIRQQLELLLKDASDAALRYGAVIGSNGRAVRIVSKLMPTLAGTEEAGEDDSLNALLSNLEGHSRPVVVVVHAISNAVEGEQVLVDLSPHDVSQAFDAGQVVASTHIDANQPDVLVQQAIAQFLQTDVRNAAIRAGTIPQVDPSTGASQIGQFDSFDLVRLVEQARRLRGNVVVRAVAISPTTSADPLDRQHMRLDVMHAPAATQ